MPKKAKPKGRARGVHSPIQDLVFRSTDRPIVLELGRAILPTPDLTSTIFGSSTISLEVKDPDRRLLRNELLSTSWGATVDGMHFVYPGSLGKAGDVLTIGLDERWVSLLKKKTGPKSARRSEVTRAEFIKSLVEEAAPGLTFVCPQLHVKQPIKKPSKQTGKKAKDEADENRGKGIGAAKLEVFGKPATEAQKEVGERALRTAAETAGITQTVEEALMCALIDESGLGSLTGGKNVLEALGAGAGAEIGDVEFEVHNFLVGAGGYAEGAIEVARKNPGYSPPEIATTVQRNAAFLNGGLAEGSKPYARFTSEAREWVQVMGGGEFSGGELNLHQPFEFKVKGAGRGNQKPETYWAAIQRLAKEVNWRAFIDGDKFFYMPETELFQGKVWLTINDEVLDDEESGVENVDFEYDGLNPVTEIEIEALVDQWAPPIGGVILLEDHGPASIGFERELHRKVKGERVGLTTNRPARTGEGGARYIVAEIEVPLSDDLAQRMAKIKCHRPTAPLPERSAATISAAGGSSIGEIPADMPPAVVEIIEAIDTVDAAHPPYLWGGGHSGFAALGDEVDCSGFVSQVVHVAGFLSVPLTSGSFASVFPSGEGEWVTIYGDSEHVLLKVKYPDGHWRYAGTSASNPGRGAGWLSDSVGEEGKAAHGSSPCHPPGL